MIMSVSPHKARGIPVLAVRLALLASLALVTGCTLVAEESDGQVVGGPPVVRIAAPLPNATYQTGVPVIIQASVSNAGPDIARVEVAVDNVVFATLQSPNQAGAALFSVTQTWTAAAGRHVITVTAFRGDGSSGASEPVTVNVVDLSAQPTATQGQSGGPQSQVTPAQPSATSAPTNTPAPTAVPASPTPIVPTARFNSGINVRSGPGTNFTAIGAYTANNSAEILAVNIAGDWLRVRYGAGDGWVYAPLVTIDGDISGLPREVGPPTPIPPPTAIPPTPVPATTVNLTFANQSSSSAVPPTCNVPFNITVTVINNGTGQSGTATILVEDVHRATGAVQASSGGALLLPPGGLAPGQTHTVVATLTVSTFYNEDHFIRIKIDPNNQVPETIETDNEQQLPYTLQRGAC